MYIVDTGLVKTGAISFSENYGALLENFVYNNFRLNNKASVYYYSGKNGCECDFIVQIEKFNCIQVCWELNTDNQNREINGLLDAMEFFNLNEGVILTYNTEDVILTNKKMINVVPVWKYNYNKEIK